MQKVCIQAARYTPWDRVCSTSLQDLLDLDMVGTETTVELEVVGVIEERASKRKQQLL